MIDLPVRKARSIAILLFCLLSVSISGCQGEASPSTESASVASETSVVDSIPTTTSIDIVEAEPSTTVLNTTTSVPESNLFGGDDPEDQIMPEVVCMNLQDAQNEIQDHGVFFSRSEDATGQGRFQIIDRNWVVVAQKPSAGTPIGEFEAVLSAVKIGEPTGGRCP